MPHFRLPASCNTLSSVDSSLCHNSPSSHTILHKIVPNMTYNVFGGTLNPTLLLLLLLLTHTGLTVILPGEPWLVGFLLHYPSPYILFYTIPPRHFSDTKRTRRDGGEESGVEGKYKSNWCRYFEAGCPSCHQWVLKTCTRAQSLLLYAKTDNCTVSKPILVGLCMLMSLTTACI